MPVIRVLLVVLLALIAYVEVYFWRRLSRIGMPLRFVPPETLALIVALPLVWLALELLVRKLTRDPDVFLRWARERVTRRLLKTAVLGPRSLTFDDTLAVRRARRSESHLVLDTGRLWIIVPIHALNESARAELLAEAEKKRPFS